MKDVAVVPLWLKSGWAEVRILQAAVKSASIESLACSRRSDPHGVTMRSNYLLKEWKIFDPRDPLTAAYGSDLVDASVTKRAEGWWMVLAGQPGGHGVTDLYSAKLPDSTA